MSLELVLPLRLPDCTVSGQTDIWNLAVDTRFSSPECAAIHWTVREVELLHIGTSTRVTIYHGRLCRDDRKIATVACKLAFGDDAVALLTDEARLYHEKLQALQGRRIPICYRFYTGTTPEGPTF